MNGLVQSVIIAAQIIHKNQCKVTHVPLFIDIHAGSISNIAKFLPRTETQTENFLASMNILSPVRGSVTNKTGSGLDDWIYSHFLLQS
jgi:hypothetical protein